MAGGKVHGKGGHGRNSREMQKKYAGQIEAQKKIARAQAKTLRWLNARAEIFMKRRETTDLEAQKAINRIMDAVKIEGSKKPRLNLKNALIRILATDAWYFEQVKKVAEELKILHEFDIEDLHLIGKAERETQWNGLIGTHQKADGTITFGRSMQELKEEIAKWKRRVPAMARGEYFK